MFFHGRKIMTLFAITLFAGIVHAKKYDAVPGQYVVTLKERVSKSMMNTFSFGESKIISVVESANIVVIQRNVIEARSSVLETLNAHPDIKIAEPNYIYKINKIPNDPELKQLWGLVNTGQKDADAQVGIRGIDVNVQKAWDIETGSKDVVVAVIDTGIDTDLEDLKDNLWVNKAEATGVEGVDDDNNGYIDDIHGYNFNDKSGKLIDDVGHGSHVSGTIGAKGNDGKGIVGVNWNVSIMGLKFLGEAGGTLEGAIAAIDYATLNGAQIMSNSWGGGGFSQQLKDAIDRAAAQGILFVVAAGNSENDNDANPDYPAGYDSENIISVAALDNKGNLASFSNFGAKSVHVAAPGVHVVSSTPAGLEAYSGTSMACPHVSGIAALLLAKFPNMKLADLKSRIIGRAKPLATLAGKVSSGGLADAFYSLTDTAPPPDANDPSKWISVAKRVKTRHPYRDNSKRKWTLRVRGAKKISVYFKRFETENGFDVVNVLDKKGNIVGTLTGDKSETWSPVVEGDRITLQLVSDRSIHLYGFDIIKVAYDL